MTTLDEFRGSLKGAVPPSGIDHALRRAHGRIGGNPCGHFLIAADALD